MRLGAILFELSLLGTTLVFGEEGTDQPAQVTTTENVNFVPGGVIRFNGSYGDLNLEGWDRPEVEITVIKSLPYDYEKNRPDTATKHLEAVRILTERKSNTDLVISTNLADRDGLVSPPLPRKTKGRVNIEYDIHAPRDSKLVIHHANGIVFVNDVSGDIEATCGRGDIVLMLRDAGAYSIDAKSRFGTVRSDFPGTVRLKLYRLGQRYAVTNPSSPGRIYLRVGFGGITIKAILPETRVSGK